MKKKITVIIILGIIFGIYTILNMPLHDSSTLCESKGGKWSEQSKLCAGIDDFTCTVSGGRYNGCDNQYVDENGTVKISPTGMCMSTCQFK